MTWESIEIAVGRGIVYGFLDFLRGFDFVLLNGGWILLALFLGWLLFINRWIHIMLANIAGWKIITLNISIPDMPSPSIMSAEQIFTHLHNYRELNWRERWLKGMVLPWYSFEIVSLGGSVHFIVKCVDFMLDHVKAAIYSQYPEAEITEVGDYIEAIHTPYNPENVDYDFWGTELMLNQHDAIPVKTYESFEHRAA